MYKEPVNEKEVLKRFHELFKKDEFKDMFKASNLRDLAMGFFMGAGLEPEHAWDLAAFELLQKGT